MPSSIIKPRGDTKANWKSANPILKEREMCIEWDETIGVGKPGIKFGKVGGTTRYNDTDYAVAPIMSKLKKDMDTLNLVLNKGKIGIGWIDTLDSGACVVRIGDGKTNWKNLPDFSTNQVTYTDTELTQLGTTAISTGIISNLYPAHGDTLNDLAGKDFGFKAALVQNLGISRLGALAEKLAGLSNKDFVGILEWINDKKFDKSSVYNGLDSTSTTLALSANQGKNLSTKLGTGNLPTGMSNVVDGLTQLNSNLFRNLQGWEILFSEIQPQQVSYFDVTLSEPMTDTNYMVFMTLSKTNAYWSNVVLSVENKTNTGFRIQAWNNGTVKVESFVVMWVAIHHRLVI